MNKLLISLLLALGSVSTAFAASANTQPINYTVTLLGSSYQAASDTTTFTYSMKSGTKPAISHWVIGIAPSCGGAEVLVGSNDPLVKWTNSDPTTGVRGVKFDTGYNDGELRLVTLTLAGRWSTGEVTISVKSGNGFVLGTTQGPVCGGGGGGEIPTYTLSGTVFFDVNYNGLLNPDEIGLGGVTVNLFDGNGEIVATTATAANGSYSFTGLPTGTYAVIVGGVSGLSPTTITEHDVALGADTTVADTGYGLNFSVIGTLSANGFTIGYWKNNLDKALKGTVKGVQVSAATLNSHTATIGSLALEPFSGLTMSSASSVLSSTSSQPRDLLAKQLLASEYNYANGAYLGGNANLTYLFIYFGEYVHKHSASYTSGYVLHVKDWFDAYNNTHGGLIIPPAQ